MLQFKKKGSKLVGVDIGTSAIKLVKLVQHTDGLHLEQYVIIPLPENFLAEKINRPELISDLVKDALARNDLSGSTAAMTIPFTEILCHTEEVDALLTDTDIDNLVDKTLLPNTSPYPLSNSMYDYFLTETLKHGKVVRQINLGVAKRDVVEERINLLHYSHLEPQVVTGGAFLFEKVLPYLLSQDDMQSHLALFDVGLSTTKFYAVNQGQLVYCRDVHFGLEDLIHAIMQSNGIVYEDALDLLKSLEPADTDIIQSLINPFLEKLNRMISQEIKLHAMNFATPIIHKVMLAGGAASVIGCIQFLNENGSYNVEQLNPFTNISIASHISKPQLANDAPLLLDAFAASLYLRADSINFMPWREQLAQDRKKQFTTGALVAAMFGAAMIGGVWVFETHQLTQNRAATGAIQRNISDTEQTITQLGNMDSKKNEISQRLTLINQLQGKRFEVLSALNHVAMYLPAQAYIVDFEKKSSLMVIKGRAANADVVATFIRHLRSYPYFNDVIVTSYVADSANPDGIVLPNTIPKVSDGYGNFEITFNLSSTPHAPIPADAMVSFPPAIVQIPEMSAPPAVTMPPATVPPANMPPQNPQGRPS